MKQSKIFIVFGSLLTVVLAVCLVSCSPGKGKPPADSPLLSKEEHSFSVPPLVSESNGDAARIVKTAGGQTTGSSGKVDAPTAAGQIEEEIRTNDLYKYQDITVFVKLKDVQKARKLIEGAGGKILYDPNLGQGSKIPFLVFMIPPKQAADLAFMTSLGIEIATVDNPKKKVVPLVWNEKLDLKSNPKNMGKGKRKLASEEPRDLYVPLDEGKVPEFRQKAAGAGLGEGTIAAIIDTGVDASHPDLLGRVVYWADEQQEFRTQLTETKLTEGKISLEGKEIALGDRFDPAQPVFAGKIKESGFLAIRKEDERNKGAKGLDLNGNGVDTDEFSYIVGKSKTTGIWSVILDTDGDGQFSEQELASEVPEFNEIRKSGCQEKGDVNFGYQGMVRFPARNRLVAYPVLFEKKVGGVPEYINFGVDGGHHGTHVAGMTAASGEKVQGIAPKAKIMAIKVFPSAGSGDDTIIMRGIIEAFYNDSKCVPDVVNMSLGSSPSPYKQSNYDYLIRDISSKFGATFVISAGNEGPGYRTHNSFADYGPSIMVGAYISANMQKRLYNTAPGYPEHSMFYFTSNGPTFNGHLKPDIAAPGAALSSIPLTAGAYEMMNGTSMAAPYTSGSILALLSLAKKSPEYGPIEANRLKKITDVFNGKESLVDEMPLQQIPLMVRNSLQESALYMTNHTRVQQGYGLLQLPGAYDKLIELAKASQKQNILFPELVVNAISDKMKTYDRTNEISSIQKFKLELVEDGEASESQTLALRSADFEVRLDQVEVEDAVGKIERITEDPPFSILLPGSTEQNAKKAVINISNDLADSFISNRKLEKMQMGKTYIANYNLYYKDRRVQSFVDIVHVPIDLGNSKESKDLPAISFTPIERSAVWGVKGVAMQSNQHHRYFVHLTERDHALVLKVGIPSDRQGTMYATVYNPDGGKSLDQEVIYRRKDLGSSPILSKTVATNGVPGVYEVDIFAGSGRWTGDTAYDLFLASDRVRIPLDPIVLGTKELAAKGGAPAEQVLTINNSGLQASQIDFTQEVKLITVQEIKGVKVMPQQWTFRRIHPPKELLDKKGSLLVLLTGGAAGDNFKGRLDNFLYTVSSDGKSFNPIYMADPSGATALSKSFKGVDFKDGQSLFVAIETKSVLASVADGTETTVDLNAIYPELPLAESVKVSQLTKTNGDKDTFLLKFQGPDKISTVEAGQEPAIRGLGNFAIQTDAPDATTDGKPDMLQVIVEH